MSLLHLLCGLFEVSRVLDSVRTHFGRRSFLLAKNTRASRRPLITGGDILV